MNKVTKIDRKFLLSHVRDIVLMFILGGLFNTFLTCPKCFSDFDLVWRVWVFSGMMWVLLWKGNELITCRLDDYISWVKEPGKRLIFGIVAMLLYTVIAATFNTYIFVNYIKSESITMTFRGSILEVNEISIGITVVIMMFFLSRDFLKSWREAAINEEKLRRENITSQYEALKNQVNPHFLFNTLNALSTLIYEDRDKALQFLNKFSDVYRYVLDSKDREVVPLKDEISFVRSYVYLLNTRYEKNLVITFGENLEEGYVPPMAVQLLVENAIKHNVIANDSIIEISIRRESGYVVVENNMNLKPDSGNPSGYGLKNIKSRYSLLSDKPVNIHNDGKLFRVDIPVLQVNS